MSAVQPACTPILSAAAGPWSIKDIVAHPNGVAHRNG